MKKGSKAKPCLICNRNCHRPDQLCGRCGARKKQDRYLEGKELEAALKRFAQWLEEHPDPWKRAQSGLMMAVPHDPKNHYWP